MTQPKARTKKGDYVIAGQSFWGFTATKKAGMPTSFPLERWMKRSIAVHLAFEAHKGELGWAKAIAQADDPDKAADPVVATCLDARRSARDAGTDVHHWIEQLECFGVSPASAPGHLRSYLDGYLQAKAEHGWTVVWSERTVAHPSISHPYAGTADMGLRFPGLDGVVVADAKTGKAVYADVAVQEAAYAHCTHYRTEGDELVPLEGLNTDVGIVLHVTETGTVVRTVDLQAGWVAWLAALDLRAFNEGYRDMLSDPLVPAHTRRLEWMGQRIDAVLDLGRDHVAVRALVQHWPEGCAVPKEREHWTGHDIDRLVELLDKVEARLQSPFTAPDPLRRVGFRPAVAEGGATGEQIEAVIARCKALPMDLFAEVEAASIAAGVPNLLKGKPTTADLERLDGIVTAIEAKAAERMQSVLARADALRVTPEHVAELATFGKSKDPAALQQRHLDRIVAITGLHVDKHLLTANQKVVCADSVSGHLLAIHGTPERVVEVCQHLVDGSPDLDFRIGSFSAVCARPLLVALTASHAPSNTNHKEQTAS